MGELKGMKELFAGRHFDREIIVLCVRRYLRYKLSLRDLVEMMAERGLDIAHTTIMRWVQRYVPEFEKRWNGYARKSGRSWRVDETYLKVRGRWVYLYRAVDRDGNTVDFRLSPKRDVAAAKAFFRKALRTQLRPPASNCSTVFAKANLPCIAYVSKTKLRLRSGMQSLLNKPLPLQSPQPAYLNICTRAEKARDEA